MRTLFDIRSDKEIGSDHSLVLEVGREYCSYAAWHKAAGTFDALHYVSFSETEAAPSVSAVLAPLRGKDFQSVTVCSGFPQALLVPTKFFHNDYTLLDLLYGDPLPAHHHDAIPEWQMTNVYAFPQSLAQVFDDSFPAVRYLHAYTPAVKIYSGYVADNQLLVHFTEQHFRVLLKKETAIQLAQTYAYKTPLDVVYFLLKICLEFGLSQQEVHLVLSGLVEKESALFREVQQYFNNVHFAHPPEIRLPGDAYPLHFFTSLFNLAACVS